MSAPVPSGWTETTLGRVLQRSPSYGINAPALPRGVGKYPYLRITDIDEAGRVDIGSLPSVRDTASDTYILSEGDIVVARTGASVGKSHLFKDAGEPVVFAGFLIRLSADENAILPSYLAQLMQTAHYWDWIRENSARSGQPGVNGQQLKTIPIVLPPLPEQQAIAAALSDADGVVAGLERVIAKKRLIKQGAMQDLLTARRRLPGFSGEWEVKQLGECGQFFKGSGVRKDDAKSGELPCVRYGELYTIHHDVVRTFASHISDEVARTARLVRRGDILFAGSGETKEEIGKCAAIVHKGPIYAGGDIVVFRPTDADGVFLSYLMNGPDAQRQKASMGQGDAVVHINATALSGISIKLPCLKEQLAISEVLESMDAEIQTLSTRLAKARAVKEGMMQNLLTGRVRLV